MHLFYKLRFHKKFKKLVKFLKIKILKDILICKIKNIYYILIKKKINVYVKLCINWLSKSKAVEIILLHSEQHNTMSKNS